MVKTPPYNAGDTGSIPGQRTKIPHATEQLSLHTVRTEPKHSRARPARSESPSATTTEALVFWSSCTTTTEAETTASESVRLNVKIPNKQQRSRSKDPDAPI